jgi:hypothetical protein
MPPLTQIEADLRLQVRAMIDTGRLPAALPHRTWGGNGNGQPCSLCGKYIHPNEVEYEIEMSDSADQPTYRFHFMCHAAWQFESARKMHLNKPPRSAPGEWKVK